MSIKQNNQSVTSEDLDRYALLVGLDYVHNITNNALKEKHQLYHRIVNQLTERRKN